MVDVTALGEILIDFTPAGVSGEGNVLFERNAGGAPANVLAVLSKFGRETAFLGKVGEDAFGSYLREVLEENGIQTTGLVTSAEASTTLAFVHLKENGDRTFSFTRKPGADQLLRAEEVNYALIEQSTIFHFGSLSLTDEPSRTATWEALKYAKSKGRTITYDPNLREPLWESLEEAKRLILEGMTYADIVKISEVELEFLTGTADLEQGSKQLCDAYGLSLLLVTLGQEGSFYRLGEETGRVQGYEVKAVDTTGAGDAFLGGWIFAYLELNKPLERVVTDELRAMMRLANVTGALTTTRKGAIPALPSLEAVRDALNLNIKD